MSAVTPDWDAVVIGAGVGGLTTAAYLATNGQRVLVLEGSPVIGGSAQEFTRNKVFHFATGAHYIGDCEPGGVIPTVLRGVGLENEVTFTAMDPDEFDRLIGPGLDFRIPRGWQAFEDRLVGLFPREARGIRRTLTVLREAGEALDVVGAPPLPTPLDLARHPRALWPLLRGAITLKMLFDMNRLSEPARAAIGYIQAFVLLPSDRLPAAMYAVALHHYVKSGGWFVEGGVDRIPHALARVVRCHGGEVRTRAMVDKILVDRGRATGVRLNTGTEISAGVVVCNADIKTTYSKLIDPEHTSVAKRRWIEKATLTPTIFSVYLGLDIDLREHMPAQNVFGVSTLDVDSTIRRLASGENILAAGEYAYWATAGKSAPRAGAEGYSAMEICSSTPQNYDYWGLDGGPLDGVDYHRNPRYLERKKQVEDLLIEKVTSDLPFLKGHIVWRESSSMLTQESWTFSRHGAWAGLDFSVPNVVLRPGPRTEIKGLYLTGASSNCLGAMLGTLRGGVETASAVLGRNLWKSVKAGEIFGEGLTDKGFATPPAGGGGFHRLRVCAIEYNTADSAVIEFDVPDELRDDFTFTPGQNLTIRGEAAGEQIRRSYSICEPATTGRLRIGVKQLEGGLFSSFAVGRLQVGDVLDVSTPRGSFAAAIPPGAGHYAAIAAGSGVTPIMSIIATTLDAEPKARFTLLYGNRSVESTMFRAELDELSQRHPDRLRVVHYLSRQAECGSAQAGRIDRDALAGHLSNGLTPDGVTAWLLCGPTGLVDTAHAALIEHGVDRATIHHESFDSTPKLIVRVPGPPATVTVTANDIETSFTLARNSDTILDAAVGLRDDLTYSCRTGSCGSCIAQLRSGQVEMDDDRDVAITSDQIEAGYILTCLARPLTDAVMVDCAR